MHLADKMQSEYFHADFLCLLYVFFEVELHLVLFSYFD